MTTGARYSYTDTTADKRSVSDLIFLMDWTKAPLLNIFGMTEKNSRKFKIVNWPSTKVELIEDSMSPYADVMNDSGGISNSDTTMTVTNGAYFRKGDLLKIESEYVMVTGVSGNDLTITRGYAGSTAASHADALAIELVTRAMPEGADFTTGHTTSRTAPYNYTQIISEAAQVSRTQQRMSQYAINDELDYQVTKLFNDGGNAGKLPQLLQKTFYHSLRAQRTANVYGSMGGMKTFVSTNVYNLASAAITRAHIHTAIRDIRQAGGEVTHLVCGSWGVEKITAMYEGLIRTTRDETRGGSEITMVKTPFGEVEVVYDWMCPDSEYYFVNSTKVGWLPFDAFKVEEIAKRGDYYVKDVVGEYTFLVANEESHAYIYGASTTK